MGTRGLTGFVIDGQVKAQYQQFDSYPSGVGADVVAAFASGKITAEGVRAITLVKGDSKPTKTQIKRLEKYSNTGVSTGSLDEWYVLLRETQGDVLAMIEAGFMIDSSSFAADSLFCEWGYLINLDTNTLEVYRGFQTDKSKVVGRFAEMVSDPPPEHNGKPIHEQYYPITLVAEFKAEDLNTFNLVMEKVQARDDVDYYLERYHTGNASAVDTVSRLAEVLTDLLTAS
jgi:hypothetical protein